MHNVRTASLQSCDIHVHYVAKKNKQVGFEAIT